MKGIVLAGGPGSRLYPITQAVSKQLLPIYDKPMIFYPISVLMLAGIKDFVIVTQKENIRIYKKILAKPQKLGIKIKFQIQNQPLGIAHGLKLGAKNTKKDIALILGDNIFYGHGFNIILKKFMEFKTHGQILITQVQTQKTLVFLILINLTNLLK